MIYGYARVSSRIQATEGHSLDSQEKQLREAGAQIVYKDSFTGMSVSRPQFDVLLEQLKSGDTLIVTKLDRFARSASKGYELMEELINRGVTVNILNLGVMDNTPMSKMLRNIFFAFAQFDRDQTVERLAEGKAMARLDPEWKEGRPPHPEKDRFVEIYESWQRGEIKVKEGQEILGITKKTWYDWRDEAIAEDRIQEEYTA